MIYITSSELYVTNYDRMIYNCTFLYRNENILILKKYSWLLTIKKLFRVPDNLLLDTFSRTFDLLKPYGAIVRGLFDMFYYQPS